MFLFSCLGHFFVHFCLAFYFVIVLSLESEWQLPYHQLLGLWTLGSLMVGAAALPAGLVADRIGAAPMMAAFFVGLGVCVVGAGFASGTGSMLMWLTGIGLFAAIYHPVGIPWLVRNTTGARGKALAVNGIFGSFGGAAAGLVSGLLIDAVNWRAAFILPGVAVIATGLAVIWAIRRGQLQDLVVDTAAEKPGAPAARVFTLLMISMFISGLIYNGTQTALPKVFELRSGTLAGDGLGGIGLLVAAVYVVAGVMQLVGGHLADRFPLKAVYVGALALQVPLLAAAIGSGGALFLVVSMLMVVANVSALPAENMMLARYASSRRHGLAFGAKFVLTFGAAPLAVQLVATVQNRTGDFHDLFLVFTCCAAVALLTAVLLPPVPRLSRPALGAA